MSFAATAHQGNTAGSSANARARVSFEITAIATVAVDVCSFNVCVRVAFSERMSVQRFLLAKPSMSLKLLCKHTRQIIKSFIILARYHNCYAQTHALGSEVICYFGYYK